MSTVDYLNDIFCKDGDESVIYSMHSLEKTEAYIHENKILAAPTVWIAVLIQWMLKLKLQNKYSNICFEDFNPEDQIEIKDQFDIKDHFDSEVLCSKSLGRKHIPSGIFLLVPNETDLKDIKNHHAIIELPYCEIDTNNILHRYITAINGVFFGFETLKMAVEAVLSADLHINYENAKPLEFISASKRTCSYCYEPSKKKCPCGCRYCSDNCQKIDWKAHKKNCIMS